MVEMGLVVPACQRVPTCDDVSYMENHRYVMPTSDNDHAASNLTRRRLSNTAGVGDTSYRHDRHHDHHHHDHDHNHRNNSNDPLSLSFSISQQNSEMDGSRNSSRGFMEARSDPSIVSRTNTCEREDVEDVVIESRGGSGTAGGPGGSPDSGGGGGGGGGEH